MYLYHFLQSTYPTLNIDNAYSSIPIPKDFILYQNYPNPFNSQTTLSYRLAKEKRVSISIFDIYGNNIKRFNYGIMPPGKYDIQWDGKNNLGSIVSSGMYFYILNHSQMNQAKKMILAK